MKIINVDLRSLPVELMNCAPRAAHNFLSARTIATNESEEGRLDWKVVLVRRAPDTLVAYRGSGNDEWVMQHGDKLSLNEAAAHFPNIRAMMAAGGLSYDG